MEHQTDEVLEMPLDELNMLVNKIIDARLLVFRTQLELDFVPIRLSIISHDAQMAEIRNGQTATNQALGRIEGRQESYLTEMHQNHKTNAGKLDRFIDLFNKHLGEHDGMDKFEEKSEDDTDRTHSRAQGWVRAGLGLASAGGAFKFARDWWLRHHHH